MTKYKLTCSDCKENGNDEHIVFDPINIDDMTEVLRWLSIHQAQGGTYEVYRPKTTVEDLNNSLFGVRKDAEVRFKNKDGEFVRGELVVILPSNDTTEQLGALFG